MPFINRVRFALSWLCKGERRPSEYASHPEQGNPDLDRLMDEGERRLAGTDDLAPTEAPARPTSGGASSGTQLDLSTGATLRATLRPAGEGTGERPLRILMGYVPEVSEKDARFFASGVAEKNTESGFITYLGLFRYETGYAYEIHEGGHGRSYLEPLLRYYQGLPPGQVEGESAVFIATAQRLIQVEKLAEGGLVCVQLPEGSTAEESVWLVPTVRLKPLQSLNTGMVLASTAFLLVSAVVALAAYWTRFQPYEAPPAPQHEHVRLADLPSQRWNQLPAPPQGQYIHAWRYQDGKWQEPQLAPVPKAVAAKPKEDPNVPLPPVPTP